MTDFVDLLAGEVEIDPSEEFLYRQVPEHQWDSQAGRPASTAFGPANIDQKKPSFSRSSLVSAQSSRDWHQRNAKSPSKGVWACTTSEVVDFGSRSIDDSQVPPEEGDPEKSPGHCFVDYRHLDVKTDEKTLRGLLLAAALRHGEVPTTDILTVSTDGQDGAAAPKRADE